MIEIYMATHKQVDIQLPACYKKMQVNCKVKNEHWDNYSYDDTGINISEKNYCYCELTALFEGWKNSKALIKGLCHYRRFLSDLDKPSINPLVAVDDRNVHLYCVQGEAIEKYLQEYDILLPMPYGPYPEKEYDDLKKYVYEKDIQTMISVINNEFPEYAEALKLVLNSKNITHYNMFIARSEIYDAYCEWLFAVLESVESKCDIQSYDTQHKRIYGYMGEVLLNVYVQKHNFKCKYLKLLSVVSYVDGITNKNYRSYEIKQKIREAFEHRPFYSIIELFYKYRKPEIYEQYLECKKFIQLDKKKIVK